MDSTTAPRPQLHPRFIMRWEASQDAHVILYPEGLIKLSPSAAEILQRCDGTRTDDNIIDDLAQAYPSQREAITQDTASFLAVARDKGWILE